MEKSQSEESIIEGTEDAVESTEQHELKTRSSKIAIEFNKRVDAIKTINIVALLIIILNRSILMLIIGCRKETYFMRRIKLI